MSQDDEPDPPICHVCGGMMFVTSTVPLETSSGISLVQRTAAQRKIEWYHAQAAECAAAANIAIDPQVKAFNDAEAKRWLHLAEAMERKLGGMPQLTTYRCIDCGSVMTLEDEE